MHGTMNIKKKHGVACTLPLLMLLLLLMMMMIMVMTVKISVYRDLMPSGWYVEDVSEKSTVISLKLEASSDVVELVGLSNALR